MQDTASSNAFRHAPPSQSYQFLPPAAGAWTGETRQTALWRLHSGATNGTFVIATMHRLRLRVSGQRQAHGRDRLQRHVTQALLALPRDARPLSAAQTLQAPPEGSSARLHHLGDAEERGFLSSPNDPLRRLASPYDQWEQALDDLPKRIVAAGRGSLRRWLRKLPEFPAQSLIQKAEGDQEAWRAMLLLSFLAHGYLWNDGTDVPDVLPANIAKPWCTIAEHLGVPPVLNYSNYILHNWRRLDDSEPVELGNIVCLNNFLGGLDEEWFRLVHVEIEARAAPALASILPAQAAALEGNAAAVEHALIAIAEGLQAMCSTMERMHDKCDPYMYFERVRLPTSGWRNNDAMPNGLLYEGVSDVRQQFYGASGAQSSILPALDAALGMQHPTGWLKEYLQTMRQHMPREHRAFIAAIEDQAPLRDFVKENKYLLHVYDACIDRLTAFRKLHRGFARSYIEKNSNKGAAEKGTGGTTFMPALQALTNATAQHALGKPVKHAVC